MLRFFRSIITFLLLVFSICAVAQTPVNKQVNNSDTGTPVYLEFDKNTKRISVDKTQGILTEKLSLNKHDKLTDLDVINDRYGYSHQKFQQYFKGIKVEAGVYTAHGKNGLLESVSGEFYKIPQEQSIVPTISEEKALSLALQFVGAKLYKWELDEEEKWLKREMGDKKASYFPKADLVFSINSLNRNNISNNISLTYKFDIYAHQPISRAYIYVDANTGQITHCNPIIKHASGMADTRYNGKQHIETLHDGNTYRLKDISRGKGIETFNLQNTVTYSKASLFSDQDNNWTSTEFNNTYKDNSALDAHWGAIANYDYWKVVHNRNSFDGKGAKIKSYVHYGVSYENAFWDGLAITYGDGHNRFDALTSLDIIAHEFGHAICQHTANLTYYGESGALNEGFSDIWAAAVESYAAPDKSKWLIGEDVDLLRPSLRSLSDPKAEFQPNTYKGQYWYFGDEDYGGVHTNSGVLNHWFYILSAGKSGINDIGDSYNVNGIGIEKAASIAYRTESIYLSPNSNYLDTRNFSIQAAIDLFGVNSIEAVQTAKGWHAVGVKDISGTPSSLTAEITDNQLQLTWADNSSNELGYKIERSLNSDVNFVEIATVEPNKHTFLDSNLPQGIYYYKVRAITPSGLIEYSNIVSAIIGISPIIMRDTTITTCGATFVDPGGLGNYFNNINTVITFIPPVAGNVVQLSFSSFHTEGKADLLKIYDGSNIYSPLIAVYSGDAIPTTVTASALNAHGSLTIQFVSNSHTISAGWQATISCIKLPGAPSNLTATALSDTQVNLTWKDNSTNETGFIVERSADFPDNFIEVAKLPANKIAYVDSNLNPNTKYYYRVNAFNEQNYSQGSNIAEVNVGFPPIIMGNASISTCSATFVDYGGFGDYGGKFQNVTLVLSPVAPDDKISVNFHSFNTNYDHVLNIYDGPNNSSKLLARLQGTASPTEVIAQNPLGKLTLTFITYNYYTNSAPGWIATISCRVAPPSNVIASAVSATTVKLTWTDNSSSETGFIIERVNGGEIKEVGRVGTNITSFIDTNVPTDANYTYRVKSVREDGASSYATSNQVKLELFSLANKSTLKQVTRGAVAWADYDNDGDLDAIISGWNGLAFANSTFTTIYNNDNGILKDISAGLQSMMDGSLDWGDYDNDGDLDILMVGASGWADGKAISIIYKNTNNTFEDINAPLIGCIDCSARWGDYDNDGDLDILISGYNPYNGTGSFTRIYNNDNGSFSKYLNITESVPLIYESKVIWGDYDNDGDLDFLQTGSFKTALYQNEAGSFKAINANIIGLEKSNADWGDYDNDGDLDLAIMGYDLNKFYAKIYKNTNGIFADINAYIPGNYNTYNQKTTGSIKWGDYDNDGDLDILIGGSEFYSSGIKIYENENSIFISRPIKLSQYKTHDCSLDWGDYDNDGDLDVLKIGGGSAEVYKNNMNISNTSPSAPENLKAIVNGNQAILSWNKANDTQTIQAGLTYNVHIGTRTSLTTQKASMANLENGYRQIPALGNVQHKTNGWTIKDLPNGTYFWRVQAIDHSFAGSAFSTESIFTVGSNVSIVLSDVVHTYDGTSKQVSISTIPANLPVYVTYNGSTTLPTDAGTYQVNVEVNNKGYFGSTTETLTINKANASITLNNLIHRYDNTSKQAHFITSPTGLAARLTYDGESFAPSKTGIYAVEAKIEDNNYSGNTEGLLVINKIDASILLSNLIHWYDGKPKAATVTTLPTDLEVNLTYNGSPALPVNPGIYTIHGTIINSLYTGEIKGKLLINKIPATITLGELTYTFDGEPKAVEVSTIPSNLAVEVTYNGEKTLPFNANKYFVSATISDAFYVGSITDTLVIVKAPQKIVFESLPDQVRGINPIKLQAYATSGLPITYKVKSGPASINGDSLTLTGPGHVAIIATQTGNDNFEQAQSVEQTFLVEIHSKRDQVIVFDSIPNKNKNDKPFLLNPTASSSLDVQLIVVSGPALIEDNIVILLGAGEVTVKALQEGNDIYNAALPVYRTFCVIPDKPSVDILFLPNNTVKLVSSSKENNQWILNGTVLNEANIDSLDVEFAGEYAVEIMIDGCKNISDIVYVTDKLLSSYSQQTIVYPNPTTDKLLIEYIPVKKQNQVSLQLYSVLGVKIESYSLVYQDGKWRAELLLDKYTSGSYILVIKDEEYQYTRQVIKL